MDARLWTWWLAAPADVLLTDIEMPELTGLELAGEIKRRKLPVKVVILTTFARPDICGGRWMRGCPGIC